MSQKIKDLKKRNLYNKYEVKRLEYLSSIHNLEAPIMLRISSSKKLNKLPRNSCLCRVRNRCVLTGRARGMYRFLRMSRIMIREIGSRGDIMGLVKSSW